MLEFTVNNPAGGKNMSVYIRNDAAEKARVVKHMLIRCLKERGYYFIRPGVRMKFRKDLFEFLSFPTSELKVAPEILLEEVFDGGSDSPFAAKYVEAVESAIEYMTNCWNGEIPVELAWISSYYRLVEVAENDLLS
jgi:hypothetical protein